MPIVKLVDNLSSQVELHSVLLDILETESELPATCTVLELEDLHSVRDMAVQNIAVLEQSRIAIIEEYKKNHQITRAISLKDIIDQTPLRDRQQLIDFRSELKCVVERIQQISKKNAEKAIARMACFNEIQNNMQKALKRIPTYSMKGVLNRPKGAYFVKRSI